MFNKDGNADQQNQQPTEPFYVGEGKKFATVEELDKGYAHANDHIGKIESENAQLREQLEAATSQSDAVNKVLEALKGNTEVKDQQQDQQQSHQGVTKEEMTEVVANLLQQQQQESVAETNVSKVEQALTDKYGEKAKEMFDQKAKELNVNLEQLSQQSPDAVIQLFGNATAPQPSVGDSSVDTSNLGRPTNYGTKAYWDNEYKEGRISRDEKFRKQHEFLGTMGAEKFYGN